MPTINELAVKMNKDVATALARNLSAMPEDKATWKPLDQGRTALNQVVECGAINQITAKVLTERPAEATMDQEAFGRTLAENDTSEKALTLLEQGTSALVAAIEAFPPEHLDDKIKMPWGQDYTFAELMFLCHWNVVYHIGQISYIQTLYGDKEMH